MQEEEDEEVLDMGQFEEGDEDDSDSVDDDNFEEFTEEDDMANIPLINMVNSNYQ